MQTVKTILIILSLACVSATSAYAVQLPHYSDDLGGIPLAHQYGDFYSYSLPVLEYLRVNGYLPGSSYAVQSSPGLIKDDIVIMAGSNGAGMVDNSNNGIMDDAYVSPSANSISFFNTGDSENSPSFYGDNANYWDIQLASLTAYLGGDDLIFMFNHNETGNEQDVYAWGQVRIIDSNGYLPTLYYDFTNTPAGGVPVGLPNAYTSAGSGPNPGVFDINNQGDWVLAPGQISVMGDSINHNLGANEVAYAVFSPELNAAIHLAGYDIMSADFRMRGLNGGAEQLFIQSGHTVYDPGNGDPVIPEPATMLLLGSGLLGLAGAKFRIKKERG